MSHRFVPIQSSVSFAPFLPLFHLTYSIIYRFLSFVQLNDPENVSLKYTALSNQAFIDKLRMWATQPNSLEAPASTYIPASRYAINILREVEKLLN